MNIKDNIAVSDSGFVFNPNTGESFTLNPLGSELFNLIKTGKEYEEIRDDILSRYDIDEVTVERDYHDFAGLLKQFQLIETDRDE